MKSILALTVAFLLTHFVSGQEVPDRRLLVSAGLSTQEVINLGGRYYFNQSAIGLNVGTFPDFGNYMDESRHINFSISYYQHLWGHSRLSNKKPWYIRPVVAYSLLTYNATKSVEKSEVYFAMLFVGREFNVTKRFGLNIAAGPYFYLYYWQRSFTNGTDEALRGSHVTVPAVDLAVFYRI